MEDEEVRGEKPMGDEEVRDMKRRGGECGGWRGERWDVWERESEKEGRMT